MSYILDALRKSDQQRHRGAAPTLLLGQATAVAPRQPAYLYYGLLAVVLLGAGILIGWLRPWQAEQAAPAASVAAAKPAEANLRQSAPMPAEIAPAPRPQVASAAPVAQIAPANAPAAAPAPVRAPAPALAPARVPAAAPAHVAPAKSKSPAGVKVVAPSRPQDTIAAVSTQTPAAPAAQPPVSVSAAPAQNVIWLAELPLALQQELPPMAVSVHAYSGRAQDRLVGINNRMLREGDYLAPGLKLEQITPEGMVFSYKGYSFRRGVK